MLSLAGILQSGCRDEVTSPPTQGMSFPGDGLLWPRTTGIGDTSNPSSGILYPDSALNLYALGSHATYLSRTVASPTLVSFSISDFDTTGLPLLPRVMVFGPGLTFSFLRNVNVHMNAADVGLAIGDSNNSHFMLYRRNDSNGHWEFHDNPKIARGATFNFVIRRNGVYALGPLDTSWTASGLITPDSGGTVSLLSSVFSAPAGAVTSPTVVSFTIAVATPEGLPGATDRIFEFEPEGTFFQTPCTVCVSFEDAGVTGEKVPVLHFYYFDPENFVWVSQPTQIEWQRQRFVVTLAHFSRYAFGR